MGAYGSYSSFEEAVAAQLELIIASESTAEKACGEASAESGKTVSAPFSNARSGTWKTENDAVNPKKNSVLKPRGRIISLASGSRANCTLVELGGTRVLIDFGLSFRMAKGFLAELGVELSSVDAVFITHEHSDHVAGLCTLMKKYSIPVHMTEPSFLAYTRGKGFECRDGITVHPLEFAETVGELTVTSCAVNHDSAACVSYLVEGEGFSFCSCTDLGRMTEKVFGHISRAENVILESNHDSALLRIGPYPDELKRRIRSENGHLSNDQCAEILVRLAKSGVKRVLLAHVSPENNTPEIVLHSAIQALDEASLGFEYLEVAPRLSPISLL